MVEDRGTGLTQINCERGIHSNRNQGQSPGYRLLLVFHIIDSVDAYPVAKPRPVNQPRARGRALE